jgi:hypothetical protein
LDWAHMEPFGYIAAKFYLCPLDKSTRYPYGRSYCSIKRFSFVVGIVKPDRLSYKGQQLEGFLFNTKGMAGLGWDFIRYASVNVGFLLYRQPSISPLSDYSTLRCAPFLSVAIDFNFINKIKDLNN